MESLLSVRSLTTVLSVVHVFAVIAVIVIERRRPASTVAWILALVFMPVVGLLAYLAIGPRRRVTREQNRAEPIARQLAKAHTPIRDENPTGLGLSAAAASVAQLTKKLTGAPPTTGNEVTVHTRATDGFAAMNEAIDAATASVHALYYIVAPDSEGQAFAARLAAAARRGAEVRVMVDAVGSLTLPRGFWDDLIAAGGEVATFGKPSLVARFRNADRFDFRNHRKLLICDSKVAFFGGLNIGLDYTGRNPEIGPWRDTHVRVVGPAVAGLQATFLGDWLTERSIDGAFARFLQPVDPSASDVAVQVMESGPSRRWSPVRYVFAHGIALAQERVWITSPYFVPDAVIEHALVGAALRGVDVRLLLPSQTDHRFVRWASRSYYPELLDAGVRIYEHRVGFIHAKTLLIDSWLATVGSANVDLRSLELNYELGGLFYDSAVCENMAEAFLADQANSVRIDQNMPKRWLPLQILVQSVARLFSPLL